MLEALKFMKLAGNEKATTQFSKFYEQGIYGTRLLKFHLILGFVA